MATSRLSGVKDEEKSVPTIEADYVNVSDSPNKAESDDVFSKNLKEYAPKGLTSVKKRQITRQNNKLEKTNKSADKQGGTKQIEEELTTGYAYLDVVQPPYNLKWLAKLSTISAPHYAAIRAKEANIIGPGLILVESPKTKRKLERLDSEEKLTKNRRLLNQAREELYEYFEGMNDDDSITDILARAWHDYESTGQGYIEIGREETPDPLTGKRQINYFGHIPSTTMRVRKQRDGYIQMVANRVTFFRNFGEDAPNPIGNDDNPNEIIMIKKYNALSSFYGLPDIVSATTAVAGNEFASRFNLDYFENKAVPRHIIVLKGGEFSVTAKQRLTTFFDTGLKGEHHRSMFVDLPADKDVSLEVKPVENSVQDQSFEKYKKNNLAEILMAHRVPANKIGMSEGMSVAASLDASKTFKEQVCQPQQRMMQKKMNKILREFTDVFEFEFNELSLTDEDTQSKIWERYLRMQVVVPNEVRTALGMAGRKGGDKPVELSAQKKAEQKAEAGKTRQEDADRNNATTTTNAEGRNPKGEGNRE